MTATVAFGVPSREDAGHASPPRRGRVFLIVPLVLVNLAAIWGQAGWAQTNLHHGLVVAVLFALAVESIGMYLAWESHESAMADAPYLMLRLGSYGIGALAGALNYLHFRPEGLSTACAFGALSAVSPWLWGVWSRSRNRGRLAELGMVDVRGVKLGTARKLFHPFRSFQVTRWAAWEGITSPAEAVTAWNHANDIRNAVDDVFPDQSVFEEMPSVATIDGMTSKERIKAIREEQPELNTGEIARIAGCSDRWVRNVLTA